MFCRRALRPKLRVLYMDVMYIHKVSTYVIEQRLCICIQTIKKDS